MKISLHRNISWSLFGNGIYAASQWALLIVIARLGGTIAAGQYALCLAIVAPVSMFSNFALRQFLVTDVKNHYSFSDYLILRLLTNGMGLLLISSIALLFYPAELEIIILLGLAKSMESFSDIFYGVQQRNERLDTVAKSIILRGTVGFIVFSVIFYLHTDLKLSFMGMVATNATILTLFDIPKARHLTRHLHSHIRDTFNKHLSPLQVRIHLASNALPLCLATVLVSLNVNIPRYFIERFMGFESLGIFVAMAYFIVAGNMVINSIWQASSPRMARYWGFGEIQQFKSLLLKQVYISLALGLTGIFLAACWGDEILVLLYGPEFEGKENLFTLIMVAGLFNYLVAFVGSSLVPMKLFRTQAFLMLLMAIILAGWCFLLVQRYGLLGATLSWLIALASGLLLCSYVVSRGISKIERQQVKQ